jgi:hypothetical protein
VLIAKAHEQVAIDTLGIPAIELGEGVGIRPRLPRQRSIVG